MKQIKEEREGIKYLPSDCNTRVKRDMGRDIQEAKFTPIGKTM